VKSSSAFPSIASAIASGRFATTRRALERLAAPWAAQRHEQRRVERDGLGRRETKAAHREVCAVFLAKFILAVELDGECGGSSARDVHERSDTRILSHHKGTARAL
jgi:hypothetical protein